MGTYSPMAFLCQTGDFMIQTLLKGLDSKLMIAVTLIFAVGMLMIASATNVPETGLNRQIFIQGVAFGLGLLLMFLVMCIDYNTFGDFYKIVYVLSIVALLLVYVPGLGIARSGARSWINLGIIDFQTSEIAKLGYILFLAKYLEQQNGQLDTLKDLLMPILLALPFMLLLLKQPDLGGTLVFLSITMGMVYVANINGRLFYGGLGAAILASPLAYFLMKPHQRIRIDAFLNPNDPSLPGNYQVMQSKITIGSGQISGRGIFNGVFHRYDYLPVQESDFIYAVLGEETGFIGGAIVILLFFWLLSRMMAVAAISRDLYGSLVVTGIACLFAFQIFENIGMTIGLMPVTGVTLPFMSYGGTSVITSLIAIGLVHNVYMRRRRSGFSV